jgi:hypothetical protein
MIRAKYRIITRIFLLMFIGFIIIGSGCDWGSTFYSMKPVPLDAKKLAELEKEIQMALPKDTGIVMIREDLCKPADHWLWLLYSKSGFFLGADKFFPSVQNSYFLLDQNTSNYLREKNLKSTREWIQSLVDENELSKAKEAQSLRWKTKQFDCRGSLLKTEEGDYLCVQKFLR